MNLHYESSGSPEGLYGEWLETAGGACASQDQTVEVSRNKAQKIGTKPLFSNERFGILFLSFDSSATFQ
jgi:hypothetical protein